MEGGKEEEQEPIRDHFLLSPLTPPPPQAKATGVPARLHGGPSGCAEGGVCGVMSAVAIFTPDRGAWQRGEERHYQGATHHFNAPRTGKLFQSMPRH